MADTPEERDSFITEKKPNKVRRKSSRIYDFPDNPIQINNWTKAKCICIESPIINEKKDNIDIIDKIVKQAINFMNDEWKKKNPGLILSVTGGAQNFQLPPEVKKAFKEGLIKAAKSTSAWIISGGTNYGVMRLVGDAVAEGVLTDNLTVLGVATKPLVTTGQDANDSSNEKGILNDGDIKLNPDHSHFILVSETGRNKKFGQEISFRSRLEQKLMGDDGHMVLIVVGGGKGTFETISETLEKDIPVLLVEKSGQCADAVIKICTNKKDSDISDIISECTFSNNDEKIASINFSNKIKEKWLKCPNLINVFSIENNEDIEQATLKALINKNKKDIDLKKQIELFQNNMKLAIEWNAILIARNELLSTTLNDLRKKIKKEEENNKEPSNNENNERKLLDDAFYELFRQAIIKNRPYFVEIMLENDFDVVKFLNHTNLELLYTEITTGYKKLPLVFLMGDYNIAKGSVTAGIQKAVSKIIKRLFNTDLGIKEHLLKSKLYPIQNLFIFSVLFNRFEMAFLFWKKGVNQIINALFAAQFLEKLSKIYRSDNEELIKYSKKFREAAIQTLKIIDSQTHYFINYCALFREVEYYEKNVLELAIVSSSKEFLAQPTVQTVFDDIWYGMIEKFRFSIREGQFYKFLFCIGTLGIFAPFLYSNKNVFRKVEGKMASYEKEFVHSQKYNSYFTQIMSKLLNNYNEDDKNSNQNTELDNTAESIEMENNNSDQNTDNNNNNNNKNPTYVESYRSFMSTPMVHFTYAILFYAAFLVIFSYFLIQEFPITKQEFSIFHWKTSKSSIITFVILNVMFASLLAEEIFQLVNPVLMKKPENTQFKRLKIIGNAIQYYYKDRWNIPDTVGLLLFLIAEILLFVATYHPNKEISTNCLEASKLIFCVDLIVWFLRALHFCALSQYLGPKLKILERIIKDDMRFFIIVIGIISLAFGIVSHVSLLPYKNKSSNTTCPSLVLQPDFSISENISNITERQNRSTFTSVIGSIIHNSYWPIFGELKIYDEFECTSDKCPEPYTMWHKFVFILLMIYALAILVLVNLLIAMFNSTFENIHNKTDTIWKYQRFFLIFNYFNYSSVPPPFNLIYRPLRPLIKKCFPDKDIPQISGRNLYLKFERQCAYEYLRDLEEKENRKKYFNPI